jgi:hypothetical protein
MNNEQLQSVAYLYGRSREKLKHCGDDIATYDDYQALSKRLWRMLKANDAVYDGGRLKQKFFPFMEAGRRSVGDKNLRVQAHERRIFEVKHRSQSHGIS